MNLLLCDTLWSALSTIATVGGALGIFVAVHQLRFNALLKAQDIFTGKEFAEARTKLFTRLDLPVPVNWEEDETKNGLEVCRKMDELACLAPFVGKKRTLMLWGDPLAKAWFLLKPIVDEEGSEMHEHEKWASFAKLGEKALRDRPYAKKPRTRG